jgi:hypothetical protein
MIQFTKEIQEGFILTLEHLNRLFSQVNEGDYQWAISDKRVPVGGRDYVEIGFSNPPVPNTISFLFPVIHDPGKPELVEICLHPEAASIGQTAMYFDKDMELKQDGIKDWSVFWSALSFMIEAKPGTLRQNLSNAHVAVLRKPATPNIQFVDLSTGQSMDHFITEILNRKKEMFDRITKEMLDHLTDESL